MGDYVYRTSGDLQTLGEQVRNTAIRVTLTHAEQYLQAQQQANNQASQGQPEYSPLGRADDDGRLRAFVSDEFAGIPALFTQFAVPDPDTCQPMVDGLFRVAATLQPSLELKVESNKLYDPVAVGNDTLKYPLGAYTDAVQVRMQHWTGSAADSFTFYLKQYDRSTLCQRQLAVVLALTLQAELEIKRRMLTDVWTLGETTIKVLDSLDHFHCPTRGGAAMVFTVVGAIAAIAIAAAPIAEELFAATVATAGAGIQGVGSILSTGGPYTVEQPLGGGTVPDVIQSMQSAMASLITAVDDKQRELATSLRTFSQEVDSSMNVILLSSPFTDDRLKTGTAADLDITGGQLFYDR
ncbi:hypothetical protein [Dactylosporangium sp. CA-139066]|uniref:hypothetical protein n=1 Tax=Dactylosporangium sp. CA-139066 TaxID=3239930 RepID=UPI003D90D3E2